MTKKPVITAFALGLIVGATGTAMVAWQLAARAEKRLALDTALFEVARTADALALQDRCQSEWARGILVRRLLTEATRAERLVALGVRSAALTRPLYPLAARLEEQLVEDQEGMLAVEKLRLIAARSAASAT